MTRGIRRRKHFRDMIRKTGGIGIAIENNCAIEFIDRRFYKVISSQSYSRDYRVYKSGGEVVAEQIRQERQLAPVESLSHRPGPLDYRDSGVREMAFLDESSSTLPEPILSDPGTPWSPCNPQGERLENKVGAVVPILDARRYCQ
jgi:hypothetical protein